MVTTEITNNPKRVICLYRVSTKMQGGDNDIPMQHDACHEFIHKQDNWVFVREFTEFGVSGYSKSYKKRDELLTILALAEMKEKQFDILLVFMIDRLGRKMDETPELIYRLAKNGIEVWSVREGLRKCETSTDRLVNTFHSWAAQNESEKTSERVTVKHIQMAKEGKFHGGKFGYGYDLVFSNVYTKKGRNLQIPLINEREAEIVRLMFEFSSRWGWGGQLIANYLNDPASGEFHVPSPEGGKWLPGRIDYILRNPVYKGYPTFGKTIGKKDGGKRTTKDQWVSSDSQIEEITIVPPEIWDAVQVARAARTNKGALSKDQLVAREKGVTASNLLFVGRIYCGHCKSPLTTTQWEDSRKRVTGEIVEYKRFKYRDVWKSKRIVECEGQTTYSAEKIESAILELVYDYMDNLPIDKLDEMIQRSKSKMQGGDLKLLQKTKADLASLYVAQKKLEEEVVKCLLGESKFDEETIQRLLSDKKKEIKETTKQLEEIESRIKLDKNDIHDWEDVKANLPHWRESFEKASHSQKKVMLSKIVKNVLVYKDHLDVEVGIDPEEFKSVKDAVKNNGEPMKTGVLQAVAWTPEGLPLTPTHLLVFEEILVAKL